MPELRRQYSGEGGWRGERPDDTSLRSPNLGTLGSEASKARSCSRRMRPSSSERETARIALASGTPRSWLKCDVGASGGTGPRHR